MQQVVNASGNSNAQQASFLPFLMATDEVSLKGEEKVLNAEFINILKSKFEGVKESSEFNNQEFAEIINKVAQHFEKIVEEKKATEDFTTEEQEELSEQQALATIGILDLYLDVTRKNIEFLKDLKEELSRSGVNTENINNIIELIKGENIKGSDNAISDVLNTIKPAESSTATSNIANTPNQFDNFKSNGATELQQLAEKLISNTALNQNIQNSENNSAINNQTNNLAVKENNVQAPELLAAKAPEINTHNQQASNSQNAIEPTAKQDKSIAEIMQLFKDIKNSDETLPLDKKSISQDKTTANEPAINNQPNNKPTNPLANEISNNNIATEKQASNNTIANAAMATQQNNNKQTHAENIKSEYKELAKKFSIEQTEQARTENTNTEQPQENTTSFANILAAKGANTNNKNNIKFDNTIQNENNNIELEQNTKNIEENVNSKENKALASNFNQHLYKIAQQTNIQNQINVAIKNLKDIGNQQIKIKLNPAELGSVSIEMEMVDNVAKGVITVERPEVAQHLAQNLNKVFEGFKQSGYNLSNNDIVVAVGEEQKEQQSSKQNQQENSKETEIVYNVSENELDIQV